MKHHMFIFKTYCFQRAMLSTGLQEKSIFVHINVFRKESSKKFNERYLNHFVLLIATFCFTGDDMHFHTSSDQITGYTNSPTWTVLDQPATVFSVQACSDAHLVLSTVPGVTKVLAFEIVIGTNSKSFTCFQSTVA